MECVNCQTPVEQDQKFCHSCGSQVSDADGQAAATAQMDGSSFDNMERLLREETAGDFEIEGMLGKGGMAVVYLAKDVHLQRKVAIKVLPPELTFGHGVERFKREARTAAALDHPHVIPVYRVASSGKLFWYAMKFLEGKALDDILREKGKFTVQETTDIIRQVAEALDYAHEHDVIHRDMKPANVMLDHQGRVIVTDFGIAKAMSEGTLTASGSVVGTPYYMSPEQGMGLGVVGASDQYSVGVMAYHMLAGSVPFEGGSAVEVLHKQCMVPPPPLSTVAPGLPEHVVWAVHKALAKKAEDRFPTVTAFADALRFPVPEADRGDVTAVMSVATPPDAYPADAATVVGMATPATMPGHTVPPTGAQAIQPALPTPKKKSKMGLLLLVLIAIGGGSGGWWWWSQQQSAMSDPTAQVPNEVEAGDPATLASGEASETDPANPPEAVVETVLVDAPPPPPPPRQTTPTVTQPTTGTVRISGLPRTGGSVRIDGRDVTGRSFDLAAGTHQVVLAANGFRTYTQNVSVRAGQEVTVQFPRERVVEETPQPEAPILGVLRMSIRPTADVTVDGQSYGVQSRFQESVLEGTHRLVFRRDGYATLDTTVTVAAGDTLRLNIRLREGGSF